jgi:Lon protease-like protein
MMTSKALALFPLPLLPLPGERIGLHIFEPRYQALFTELESMERDEFGIAFVEKGKLTGVGALMRLVAVQQLQPTGERDVLVQCVGCFRLLSFKPHMNENGTPTDRAPEGKVEPLPDVRAMKTSLACITEYVEWSGAGLHKDSPLAPPESLVQFMVASGADASMRSRVLLASSDEQRSDLLVNWMRSARLMTLQERRRHGDIFPN